MTKSQLDLLLALGRAELASKHPLNEHYGPIQEAMWEVEFESEAHVTEGP